MEQSATPRSNRRRNWLAIFSFILTLIPGVGWIGVASGTLPYSSETVLLVVWLGGVGLLLGIYSSFKVSSGRRIEKRVGDRLGQVSMIIGLVLLGNWLALPNFIAMRNAAKNANLKEIARTLQASTEVYKKTHNGERPVSIRDVEGLLSNKVTNQKNPFNSKQTYTISGGGLVDGVPTGVGQVGYIAPRSDSEPYVIMTCPIRIPDSLKLIEVVVKPKVDSSVTKIP